MKKLLVLVLMTISIVAAAKSAPEVDLQKKWGTVIQAIAMVESDDVAPGNVLGIMQKGYTLNGRTIRAAMVTVAKAK